MMATSKRQPAAKKRATSKRASSKRTAAQSSARAGAEFVCPECGRTFARAAALGAHRNRAHGIAGRSAQATKRRGRAGRASSARRNSTAKATTRSPKSASRDGIDRDALLTMLFPDGVPAREEVIRAAGGWLDEAERLSRTR